MNLSTNKKFLIVAVLLAAIMAIAFFPPSVAAQDGAISNLTYDPNDDFDVDDEWDEYEDFTVNDPYEKYNRKMFNFNDKVYRKVFSPLVKGYDFLIPKRAQRCFNNVFRLASTPKRFFNNLFQKKYKSSWIEFERLLINSTVGIGGLFDPATRFFNLEQKTEDFGQTLGFYNVDQGPYIIWPIVGPATRRDTLGFIGDTAFSPFFWFGIFDVEPSDVFRAMSATKRVNNYTYNVRSNYERITDSAIDPYIALQHAFIQNRLKMIEE